MKILTTQLKQAHVVLAVFIIILSGCASQPVDPATAHGNQLGTTAYTVKVGDNLVLIAADMTHERENWRRIADFNRIENPAFLRVGQTIYIPRDLIPLNRDGRSSRPVAGSPTATVSGVTPSNPIASTPIPE